MKRFTITVLTLAVFCLGTAATAHLVEGTTAIYHAISATAPAISLGFSDDELATANLASATAGMTNVEKVQWANAYTHRASNRQAQLVNLYTAGQVGHMGYTITIPAATVNAIKAEVNALADRMVTAQGYVAGLTD